MSFLNTAANIYSAYQNTRTADAVSDHYRLARNQAKAKVTRDELRDEVFRFSKHVGELGTDENLAAYYLVRSMLARIEYLGITTASFDTVADKEVLHNTVRQLEAKQVAWDKSHPEWTQFHEQCLRDIKQGDAAWWALALRRALAMPYKAPLGGLLGYGLLVFGAGLIVSGIFTRGARYEIAVGLVILAIGYSFSRAVLRLDPHLPETLKDLIQPFHAGGNVYNRNAILQELETALAVNHRREPAVVLAEIEAKLESAKERCVSFEAFKWPLIG